MVNRPKIKGTNAETAVVNWLRDNGFPHAERRSLRGGQDWGDISGVPGVCFEVKAAATLNLAGWLRETEQERSNCDADFGVLVIKPPRVGITRVGHWWAVMYRAHLWQLWSYKPLEVHHLSGAVIKYLPEVVDKHLYRGTAAAIEIHPKGVPVEELRYMVTTLQQMAILLRRAGYGKEWMPDG